MRQPVLAIISWKFAPHLPGVAWWIQRDRDHRKIRTGNIPHRIFPSLRPSDLCAAGKAFAARIHDASPFDPDPKWDEDWKTRSISHCLWIIWNSVLYFDSGALETTTVCWSACKCKSRLIERETNHYLCSSVC